MMLGTSSLTVFAGQETVLTGDSTLSISNFDALISCTSSLTVTSSVIGSASISGTSYLDVVASIIQGGNSFLPALTSIGNDSSVNYGYGDSTLGPISTEGVGGFYIPPVPVSGYSNLQSVISSGIITKSLPGDGDSDLNSITSMGGVAGYGSGGSYLNSITSYGMYGFNNVATITSGVVLTTSGLYPVQDMVIVFNSSGTIADTITGSKEYIENVIDAMTCSTEFSILGELGANVISSLVGQAVAIGQTVVGGITGPSLDSESRVWVVNMETAASSQYDDYGFTHLFNHDGTAHGIADDGIYALTGDTDAGADISALLEIGRSNYGSDKIKKVHKVWLGVGSDGNMYLKADADGVTSVYETRNYSANIKNHEVLTGKRLSGNFWNWTIMNKNGADFVLATVDFQPVELNRRQR